MPEPTAAELHRRARELRRLAEHLAATPLDDVIGQAGPDTWISPRASELRAELLTDRHRLAGAVDDLRLHARYLEREADAVTAALRLAALNQ